MSTLTLIHATPTAMPPVIRALEAVPGLHLIHQLDEGLLSEIDRHGGLSPECVARMETQLDLAVSAGSDAILTTCNAYSVTLIRDIRPHFTGAPIVVIDEPMLRRALEFDTISVLATVPAGLESQRELLTLFAEDDSLTPTIDYTLRSDAFHALAAGDGATHDRILLDEVERLVEISEVVVLAQASMSRLTELLPRHLVSRVLSSPELAARSVTEILSRGPSAAAAG